MEHTLDDCRAAIAEWEAQQPVYLGCGCLEGTHDNTTDGIRAAHPDLLGVPGVGSVTLGDHWRFHG